MKALYCFCLLLSSAFASSQIVVIDKGKDTLFVPADDTLAKIPFKVTGAVISNAAKLSIRVHSGTALPGTDFELRDEYEAPTPQINISRLQNKAGSFRVFAVGGLKDNKTINLETAIVNNGRTFVNIVSIILAPAKKGSKEEKKEEKGTSIKFKLFNDINIAVYEHDNLPKKEDDKSSRKKREIDMLINVSTIEIKQITPTEYQIRVLSTDRKIFRSILKLSTDYEFLDDDKIYLNGKTGSDFIHAEDLLEIIKENVGEKVQTITPDKAETEFKVPKN